MSSSKRPSRTEPIPRTVERCECYLDCIALLVERAGDNGAAFLPIVRRLERELAEAQSEADVLQRLRERRLRASTGSNTPNPNSKGHQQ